MFARLKRRCLANMYLQYYDNVVLYGKLHNDGHW